MKKNLFLFTMIITFISLCSFGSFATSRNNAVPKSASSQIKDANKSLNDLKNISTDEVNQMAGDTVKGIADNMEDGPAKAVLEGFGVALSAGFGIVLIIALVLNFIGMWIAYDKADENPIKVILISILCAPYTLWVQCKLAGYGFGMFLLMLIVSIFTLGLGWLWINYKFADSYTNINGVKKLVCIFLPGFVGIWGGTYKGRKGQF